MKTTLIIMIALIFSVWAVPVEGTSYDIYLIFYATHGGETGHVGIAIDNYEIQSIELSDNDLSEYDSVEYDSVEYDSVKMGDLTYYDLWPKDDNAERFKVFQEVEAEYFKLPAAMWEPDITVASLKKTGIPHKEHRAPDGIVRVKSTPYSDFLLKKYLEDLIESNKQFHAINYNCADFVKQALEFITGKNIEAEERVLIRTTTTPNRLYKTVISLSGSKIIKDPGEKINGSFTVERVLHNIRKNELSSIINNIN